MMRVLTKARMSTPYRVALEWADGMKGDVDFGPIIARGGVFASLGDPTLFAALAIGDRGRSLVWVDDNGDQIDFCADALWQMTMDAKQAAE